jgi:hypothetical protein
VGSNRIVKGRAIVHPIGDVELPPAEEKEFRLRLVQQALEALRKE